REVKPHAQEWDREERFPKEVVEHIGQLGLLGMTVPEELGGSALDTLSVACVVEEIARWDGSLARTVASHNGLGTSHLLRFGSDELRRRYIPEIAAGRKLAAWALTEPGSGSDAAGMRSTAVRKEKGWVLNGAKMFITQGTVGDVFVVLTLTDPGKRQKGVTAFLLEKGMKGFSQRALHGKLGMRSSDTAELVMEDVFVEDWRRIGEVGGGFVDTLKILDKGRITIGALAVGLGRGAGRADPWRIWIHEGVPRGAHLSRRQALHHRRRNERDPAAGDRARAAQGMSAVADRVLAGDVRAAARVIRLIDDALPEAEAILRELWPRTGRAQLVGITGNPGAGKSTLVDRLIAHLRAQGKTVGVLAVDPTSPFTGGAILGDRIRMQDHALDPGVFIRSLATRGQLGGLSRATSDSARVLDAM